MVYIAGLLEKAKAQGGTTHTVKSGETLSGIGAEYGVDWNKITGYRSGNPNLIYPGEVLTIPGAGGAPTTAAAPASATPEPQPSQDINQFLSKYQDEIMASVDQKPEVRQRSAEEIRAMVEPSVGLPEAVDWKSILLGYREEYGISDLEQALTGIKGEEEELATGFRQQRTAERGKPVPLNVIEGRIGEEERAYLERADYLGRQKSRVVDELNTKYNLVSQLMTLEQQTYQDAVSRYENEFNRNIKMYDIIRGEERDALSDWERGIDRAKANLQVYANAITAGNLSWDDLGDDQKVLVSKLEAQAGLPVGFTSQLRMSATDRLISVNEKTGEALMIGDDGNFNVVQTGMTPTPTKEKEPSEADLNRQAYKEMSDFLGGQTNDSGHVTGEVYIYARNKWVSNGGDIEEFDKQFRSYRDPYSLSQYGLTVQQRLDLEAGE